MELNLLIKLSNIPICHEESLLRFLELLIYSLIVSCLTCGRNISEDYRAYSENIPDYLKGRPRSVIFHCLERKANVTNLLKKISRY